MNYLEKKLQIHHQLGNFRILHEIDNYIDYAQKSNIPFINLSSNDYLGIAANPLFKSKFLASLKEEDFRFSASSSRLQTGNVREYSLLEHDIAKAYGKDSALIFTSGYHINSGVIPAIADKETLILADKLVHASMIDGIRLSESRCIRFRHLDYDQLERLIQENHNRYRAILIVTESIFSMDGDETDLKVLVRLKNTYQNIMLYVDEAHSVGVRGKKGLGCCEEYECMADIDFIVGTFGKALGSAGAFLVSNHSIREYLINTVRPFIFTTALPPINIAWTHFIFNKLAQMDSEREYLQRISRQTRLSLISNGQESISTSHIIPYIIGDNHKTVQIASTLQQEGFFVLPIRPPSVAQGTARLRISLSVAHPEEQIIQLTKKLQSYL